MSGGSNDLDSARTASDQAWDVCGVSALPGAVRAVQAGHGRLHEGVPGPAQGWAVLERPDRGAEWLPAQWPGVANVSQCECHDPAVFGHVKCVERALYEAYLERRKRDSMCTITGQEPARIGHVSHANEVERAAEMTAVSPANGVHNGRLTARICT